MAPSDTEQVQLESLEIDQKSFSSFFSQRTKSPLSQHSYYPQIINTSAQAQNMWNIPIKPNFEEKKSLRNFIIIKSWRMYRKIHKSQEYLFFPRMLAEYLPHLCSSFDTILSSVSYMQISPVCTRERLGLCKDSSGCCFAAQAAELSVVNPALLDGSCGLCPSWTAQCSAWERWGRQQTRGHWQCLVGCPNQAPALGLLQ